MKKRTHKIISLILSAVLLLTGADYSILASNNSSETDFVLNYHGEDDIKVDSVKKHKNKIKAQYRGATPDYLEGALPSKYQPDLAEMPAIRNQNPYGTCWAFSTIALAEYSILKNEGKLVDLSELQLAYFSYNESVPDPLGGTAGDVNYADLNGCSFLDRGGNLAYSTRILSTWKGAVSESELPYSNAALALENGIDNKYAFESDCAHLRNAYFINIADTNDIKQLIMKYGAASISYYEAKTNEAFSTSNNCYYNGPNCNYETNHAVTIVGWDDDFSADNFNIKPDGNGAWLIRNSWGSYNYSHYGYFWMSYYENSLSPTAYVYDFISENNDEYYDNNYQYDGGCVHVPTSALKCANVFTAHYASEVLKAAAFENGTPNTEYKISVYKNLSDDNNPESGELVAEKSGFATYAGFYTVPFDNSVELECGDTFSIVVSLSGDSPSIFREYPIQGWMNSNVSSDATQSFRKTAYTDWQDIGASGVGNLCIKAFTNTISDEQITPTSLNIREGDSLALWKGESKILHVNYTPSNSTERNIIWESSNPDVVSVDAGKITALGKGEAVISATSQDGKISDSITITVGVAYSEINITSSKHIYNIYPGDTYQVTIDTPEDVTETLTWSSDNTEVATVSQDGLITVVGVGNTLIHIKGAHSEEYVYVTSRFPDSINANLVKNDDGTNTITWNPITGIKKITITQLRTTEDKSPKEYVLEKPTEASFTDMEPENTNAYTLFFESNDGSYRTYVTNFLPAIRSDVISVEQDGTVLVIKWNPSPTAEGYQLYRRFEGLNWAYIDSFPLDTNSYVEQNPQDGVTYYYSIKACSSAGNAEMSQEGMSITYHEPCPHPSTIYVDLKDGTHASQCTRCEDIISEPAPHTWNAGKIISQPTFISDGTMELACTICSSTKQEPIPMLEKKDLQECAITLEYDTTTYSGTEKKPNIYVDGKIASNTYFLIEYQNNINAGEATAIVTARDGNIPYTGTATKLFQIEKASIELEISISDAILFAGENYTVTTQPDVDGVTFSTSNASIATIDSQGILKALKPGPVDIIAEILENDNYLYTTTSYSANINLSGLAGLTLVDNGDSIELSWDNAPGADGYKIYRGKSLKNMTLVDTCTDTGYIDNNLEKVAYYFYNVIPYAMVNDEEYLGEAQLKELQHGSCQHNYEYIDQLDGTHIGICKTCSAPLNAEPHSWENEQVYLDPTYIDCGQAIAFCSHCSATNIKEISPLEKTSLTQCTVSLAYASTAYDGKAKTPAISIKFGKVEVSPSYYTVSYKNNTKVGLATVEITANEGNIPYWGSICSTFNILPDAVNDLKLTNQKNGLKLTWTPSQGASGYYVYRSIDSSAYSLVTTIKSQGTASWTDKTATKNGLLYQYKLVAYTDKLKSADSTVINYVKLSTPAIGSAKNKASKACLLKWSKNSKANGYELQYSTKSSFKGAKKLKITKFKTCSTTVKKLSKKKNYYFRIRSYKKLGSSTYYSMWSNTKKVKITK